MGKRGVKERGVRARAEAGGGGTPKGMPPFRTPSFLDVAMSWYHVWILYYYYYYYQEFAVD